MDKNIYYIWLQTVCGICSSIYMRLFECYDSAKAIYDCEDFSSIDNKYSCKDNLLKKDLTLAFEIYKRCKNNGIGIISYHDEIYPDSLRRIQNPPAVLYYKGNPKNINENVCISVVGTRRMTDFGGAVAEEFAYSFAKCGAIVVSGLAKGIDAAAHIGALRAKGLTVAVLGTPIDEIYPKENEKLFYTLYETGLVISEMYPGCKKTRADFPNRNRIISALSKATIIAEAGEHSGALITARHAVVQGKKVYAIPGAIGSDNAGTNTLIKIGVEAATTPLDVLSELALLYPKIIKTELCPAFGKKVSSYGMKISSSNLSQSKKQDNKKQSPNQHTVCVKSTLPSSIATPVDEIGSVGIRILSLLENSQPLTPDELSKKLNAEVSEVLVALTMLEIEGKINSLAGNRYIKK